ncbi:MAG: DnaJ domain-containing protein [Candidatus Competibacteraceae bacterium]|nr:DnaJ domain-containing protein [Candidatus Competibacteraceae bacterium]
MLVRALWVAALLVGGYFFIRWFRRSPQFRQTPQRVAAIGLAAFLLFLAFSATRGGIEAAVVLLALLAPLVLRWFKIRLFSPVGSGAGAQGQSVINTRFLHIRLDHATGAMSGVVREGRFAGRALRDMQLAEYLDFWRESRSDPRSLSLLETFLDRHCDPAWRNRLAENERSGRSGAGIDRSGRMSHAEAYEILGLPMGASRDEIQAAYRRLMQRLHPDQGGSDYLAACLNRARSVLLGE